MGRDSYRPRALAYCPTALAYSLGLHSWLAALTYSRVGLKRWRRSQPLVLRRSPRGIRPRVAAATVVAVAAVAAAVAAVGAARVLRSAVQRWASRLAPLSPQPGRRPLLTCTPSCARRLRSGTRRRWRSRRRARAPPRPPRAPPRPPQPSRQLAPDRCAPQALRRGAPACCAGNCSGTAPASHLVIPALGNDSQLLRRNARGQGRGTGLERTVSFHLGGGPVHTKRGVCRREVG